MFLINYHPPTFKVEEMELPFQSGNNSLLLYTSVTWGYYRKPTSPALAAL